jgi:hypothetical protein
VRRLLQRDPALRPTPQQLLSERLFQARGVTTTQVNCGVTITQWLLLSNAAVSMRGEGTYLVMKLYRFNSDTERCDRLGYSNISSC